MGVTGKKLLVLDVNGLLVDTYYVGDTRPERKHDRKVNRFYVYNRPFCDEFIHFCFENFVVGVWSSGLEHNVRAIVDHVFEESKEKLAFIWVSNQSQGILVEHQKHCTDTGFRHPDNKYKPLFLKELWRLWKRIEPTLPWNEGDFDPSNTILIDDSPYKAINNPPHTAIFPKSYKAVDVTDNYLDGELRTYLEGMLDSSDVQAYIQAHPIGEPCIAVGDPQWSHVLSSVKLKIGKDVEIPNLWLGINVISSPKYEEDRIVVEAVVPAPTFSKVDEANSIYRGTAQKLPSYVPKGNTNDFRREVPTTGWHDHHVRHPSHDLHRRSTDGVFVAAGHRNPGLTDQFMAPDWGTPGGDPFANTPHRGMDPAWGHRDFHTQRMFSGSMTDVNTIAHPFDGAHAGGGIIPLPRAGVSAEPRWVRHPHSRGPNEMYHVGPDQHMRIGGTEGWDHRVGPGSVLPRSENITPQISRMPIGVGDRFQSGMPVARISDDYGSFSESAADGRNDLYDRLEPRNEKQRLSDDTVGRRWRLDDRDRYRGQSSDIYQPDNEHSRWRSDYSTKKRNFGRGWSPHDGRDGDGKSLSR